jgi:hypothetical protein
MEEEKRCYRFCSLAETNGRNSGRFSHRELGFPVPEMKRIMKVGNVNRNSERA